MNELYNNLQEDGGLYLKPNFFPEKIYNNLLDKFEKNTFVETYEPAKRLFGHRFQGYPCYNLILEEGEEYNFIKNFINTSLNLNEFNLVVKLRKVYSDEILKSKCDGHYGYIHTDTASLVAGVVHFEQTIDGGTAFFEHYIDKHPDIKVGAYPNRLIMYSSSKYHSSCQDFNFNVRKTLAFFVEKV